MALSFRLVCPDCQILSTALREHVKAPPPSRGASLYIVYSDGEEAAFISLDHLADENALVIYEIFIDPAYRMRGIGTAIMREIEALAVRRGYEKILLCPQPLDATMSRKALTSWYARLGFRHSRGTHDVMEKLLAADRQPA